MWGQASPYQVPVHQAAQQQYMGGGNGEAAAAAAAAAQYMQQQQQHAGSYQQQLYGGQQQQLYGGQQQQQGAGAYAQGGAAAGLVPTTAAAGYPAEYGAAAAAAAAGFPQEEQQQHLYSQQPEQAMDYRQQQQQGAQMGYAQMQQPQSAAYNQHAAAAVDVYGKAAMEYGMRPGDEQQQQRMHFSPYPAHGPYGENLIPAAAASAHGASQQPDDYYQQQPRPHHHHLNNCEFGSTPSETHAFSRSLPLVPVSPPADPDLVKRIHTIADYCARHPEMEAMIRERDGTNPRFAFIVGGEGYDYFRYLVACRQQQQEQQQQQTAAAAAAAGPAGAADVNPAAAAAATVVAQEQVAHAGGSSNQADGSATLAREFDIDSLIMQYQEPAAPAPLSEAFERELEELVRALEKQATSTGIRNGRHWIEVNGGVSEEAAHTLAHAIRKKQAALTSFLHKLNLLYLVHDVVQNEHVHKKNGFLLAAFKPYMVWMLRDAYQAAAREQDAVSKVERILTLWAKRGIIDEDEEEEMAFLMTSAEVNSRLQAADPSAAGFHGPVPVDLHPPMPSMGGPYATGMYGGKGASPYGFRDGMGEMPPPPPPRMPRAVGGFDRRPDDMGNTPESIPVGMMATMLRSMSKRAKNMQTAFVPYRALDPLTTPQQLPPLEPPSDYLLDRLQDFYEDLEEIEAKLNRREEREKAGERSPSASSSRSNSKRRRSRSDSRSRSLSGSRRWRRGRYGSRSRSNSAEKSPSSCLEGRLLERDRERKMREIDRGGGGGHGLGMGGGGRNMAERPSSWLHAEMGVGEDGSFAGHPGLRGARLGLGAASEAEERFERQQQQLLQQRQQQQQQQAAASDDPFEMFRRQRAGIYHDIIAINKAARQEQTQRFADKNCYICAKAGHIARDCPAKTA